MKTIIHLLALALPLLAQAQAQAQPQTVWRCGASGSSYSSTPCSDGRAIELADARPAADVQAARALAARDKQAAEQLRRERLVGEAQTRGSGLAGFPLVKPAAQPAPRPQAKRHPQAKRPADAGTWRAIAPASR